MAPTPTQEVACGVFAGVCDALASHPIDQIKTQQHVNTGTNGSVIAAMRQQAAENAVGACAPAGPLLPDHVEAGRALDHGPIPAPPQGGQAAGEGCGPAPGWWPRPACG